MAMRLACVVGARPNFMKMAPILRAMKAYEQVEPVLIHTGQHYDKDLSDIFFDELGIKKPDIALGVGSGSHAQQTAKLLIAFEQLFEEAIQAGNPFHRLVVVGDVNSTMAGTLAAAKLGLPVAHVEAGLRSFDRSMPEEINRIVTDGLSDMLFCSEPAGVENLTREGHAASSIHLTGNVMIDTLHFQLKQISADAVLDSYGLRKSGYCVVTLHRPSNVDHPEILKQLVSVLCETSRQIPIVFPIHPRTRERLERFQLLETLQHQKEVVLTGPLGYNEFLALTSNAKVIVTDSGGLQEETTALKIPCLTMRSNTERPITVSEGTSTLCGNSPELLAASLAQVLSGSYKHGHTPPLWDGRSAERVADLLVSGTK